MLTGSPGNLLATDPSKERLSAAEESEPEVITDYSKVGFYLGDSLGRMILSLGET